jgi:putative tryptophan/tyrosine transport system substrate-binding protein
MRRRTFIAGLGGAAAWPVVAWAQQTKPPPRRVGMLLAFAQNDLELQVRVVAFKQRFAQLGWTEGLNVNIEYRFAGDDIERLRSHAAELVAFAPDVILAQSNPGLVAILQTNRAIPIVFVQVADPVGSGFVESLARPGGTITGFTNFEPATGGKWVELLKDIAPDVTRAAVLMHPETAANVAMFNAAAAAGPALGLQVSAAGVTDPSGIERAIATFAQEPRGGLIALPHVVTASHRDLIARLAIERGLPSVGAFAFMVRSGCLASYGIDVVDLFGRSATYVDRILRGERPADLPVQAPTKFELAINLKTAKALSLAVPQTLLGRADEVIE